jgi:MFS family permease
MPIASPSPTAPLLCISDTKEGARLGWVNVVVAALVMLATLPGRTQGLGLITEPMLRDLQLDRVLYANINLWATLLGATCCLPAGWLLDRFGLRWATTSIILLLGAVVWRMSAHTGSVVILFLLVLLTRALGQSALSVASITAVGKCFRQRVGLAMGIYSVLLSIFFATAFTVIGGLVRNQGWRAAWAAVAFALLIGIAPLVLLFLRDPKTSAKPEPAAPKANSADGVGLSAALRTSAFWIFAGATALFGLVSSGLGLFNEAVLAERGFDQRTYHVFLAVTTIIALVGQLLCGWLSLRWSMQRLLSSGMFLYAVGLSALPLLRTLPQLWGFATLMGLAGGIITVVFFAIWSHAFGRAHLGRVQGAAQMLTVLASAIGPWLFAKCRALTGSYAPVLILLAPVVFLFCIAAWRVRLPTQADAAGAEKGFDSGSVSRLNQCG